jgi:lysozyme
MLSPHNPEGYLLMAAFIPPVQTDLCCDLSHSNEISDPVSAFKTAGESGVTLIIQKATQGTGFTDPTFAARRAAAAANNILFGAYHFCDGSDPTAQAEHFLTVVGDTTNILLALDAEKNSSQVSVDQVVTMALAIKHLSGQMPVLYMGRDGPDGSGEGLPNATLSTMCLWLPEYGNNPVCPPGFDTWTLHQYTGDGINGSGDVAGVGTGLDRSYFAGTAEELPAWFAKQVGAPIGGIVDTLEGAAENVVAAVTTAVEGEPAPPASEDSPGVTVRKQLQVVLQSAELYKGAIDGIWGSGSEEALAKATSLA